MSTESSAVETETTDVADVAAPADNAVADNSADTGASAGSPTADAKGPSSPLEAVEAALRETQAAEPSPAEGEGQQPTEAGKVEDPKAQEAADKSLPFHSHPRWKQVTGENRQLKEQVGTLSDKAQRWDAIDGKFRESGLSVDDVGPLFDGGAALKRSGATPQEIVDLMRVGSALKFGDRQIVLQIAKPVFAGLGLDIVDALPDDLRRQVEEGALTEDAAKRTASAEFAARAEAARRQNAEQAANAEAARRAQDAAANRMADAAAGWEKQASRGDADWSRKQPYVVEAIRDLRALYTPRNEQEAVRICEMALERVNRIFKTAGGGQRKPAVTPSTGGTASTATSAPKNVHEAAFRALGMTA